VPKKKSLSTGAIVGISIGGVGVGVAILVVICFVRPRRRYPALDSDVPRLTYTSSL
jgi:hypothetical protein